MTPTYDSSTTFDAKFKRLTKAERSAFVMAVLKFVEDIQRHKGFRKSLRVKAVRGEPGVFEMTWAPNGRALFSYGSEIHKGRTHIIWLDIGGHEIFGRRP